MRWRSHNGWDTASVADLYVQSRVSIFAPERRVILVCRTHVGAPYWVWI